MKSASFVKQQKQKKPKFFVSVNNGMNAMKRQESCFWSDYLLNHCSLHNVWLSSSVSFQISAFLSII